MKKLHNNHHQNRFELEVNGEITHADYRRDGTTLFIDYVYAPESLRGTGAAGALMQEIKNLAASEGWNITPICGYAAAWLKRHP